MDSEIAQEVYDTAKKAYNYYSAFFDGKGQYVFQPNGPITFDGIFLPWNQQNAMAAVCLQLWKATGEKKYLHRAEKMLRAFKKEWIEEDGKIRWRYWPNIFYAGWSEKSGISRNTPSRKSVELSKVSFEDISHAGLNVSVVTRYFLMCPDGIITLEDIEKIQKNMECWCFLEGFSASIGGRGKISYGYIPHPGWAFFRNQNLARYICQGGVQAQDTQTDFPLSVHYYETDTKIENSSLTVDRYSYTSGGKWVKTCSFSLKDKDIKAFVNEYYSKQRE